MPAFSRRSIWWESLELAKEVVNDGAKKYSSGASPEEILGRCSPDKLMQHQNRLKLKRKFALPVSLDC